MGEVRGRKGKKGSEGKRREGAEGEDRVGKGEGKGSTWIFVQGPRVPSDATAQASDLAPTAAAVRHPLPDVHIFCLSSFSLLRSFRISVKHKFCRLRFIVACPLHHVLHLCPRTPLGIAYSAPHTAGLRGLLVKEGESAPISKGWRGKERKDGKEILIRLLINVLV